MANQSKIWNSPRRRDARLENRRFCSKMFRAKKREEKQNNKILRDPRFYAHIQALVTCLLLHHLRHFTNWYIIFEGRDSKYIPISQWSMIGQYIYSVISLILQQKLFLSTLRTTITTTSIAFASILKNKFNYSVSFVPSKCWYLSIYNTR